MRKVYVILIVLSLCQWKAILIGARIIDQVEGSMTNSIAFTFYFLGDSANHPTCSDLQFLPLFSLQVAKKYFCFISIHVCDWSLVTLPMLTTVDDCRCKWQVVPAEEFPCAVKCFQQRVIHPSIQECTLFVNGSGCFGQLMFVQNKIICRYQE